MAKKSKKQTTINFTVFRQHPWRFFWYLSKKWHWQGLLALTLVSLAVSLQTSVYYLVKEIVDALHNEAAIRVIYRYLILLVIIQFSSSAAYRLSGVVAWSWILKMELRATQLVTEYLLRHSLLYFQQRLSGKLQNKIFNIANAIGAIVSTLLWGIFNAILQIFLIIIFVFSINWALGLALTALIGGAVLFNFLSGRRLVKYSERSAKEVSNIRGFLVDVITNILAVKQNVAEKRESRKLKRNLKKYRQVRWQEQVFWEKSLIGITFILAVLLLGVVVLAIFLWQRKIITIGDVTAIFTILVSLYSHLEFMSHSFSSFSQHLGKLQEGLADIFVPHLIRNSDQAKALKHIKGEVVFDKVSFAYPDNKQDLVLNQLSLHIKPGEKVGLVGESGVGKSTLVSLLLRFIDVDQGRILIDGHDIRLIRQADLRRAIAYVPQEPLLFHRTIRENVCYGNPSATEKQIKQAIKQAEAADFIYQLPQGLETVVGERGVKLSGGQKQRIIIARAILRAAPILILDEATSSLDSKVEQHIQAALDNLMTGKTTIAIAHRLSTLQQMDRILVLDKGRIVEEGAHHDLLARQGHYWQLWEKQYRWLGDR